MRPFKKFKKSYPHFFKALFGFFIAVTVSLAIGGLYVFGVFTNLENKSRDFRFRIFSDPKKADPNIVIVTVDEESLNFYRENFGTWPWPREVFASLIEYLAAGGARAIAFDILFSEPDIDNPQSDLLLSNATAEFGRVIYSVVLRDERASGVEDYEAMLGRLFLREHRSMLVENSSDILFTDHLSATLPFAGALLASRGVGVINLVADSDGPSRSIYPIFKYDGSYYPSLALALALALDDGEERDDAATIDERHVLHIKDYEIPLLPDGRMPLCWHGPFGTYRYYSIGDLLESMRATNAGEIPRVSPDEFKGKIVLVGATATSLFDLRATPFSPVYPGVELNATAIDNIINGDFVRHSPQWVTILLISLFSLFVSLVLVRFGTPYFSIFVLVVAISGFGGVAGLLFQYKKIMLDTVAPASAILASFVGSLVLNYLTEGRAKQKFKEAFAKYVSPDVAEEISKNIDDLKVDVGERREVTILFSDIRGFTSLSEKLPPEEVVRRLNVYFGAMVEIVFAHGGTLDKYIGDAIMAFFGAPKSDPEHAAHACLTALEMKRRLEDINREFKKEGIAELKIGVGINTGEVVVGNIGSERRMDYTVIGDHVNLASRLEGLNKNFGTSIIVSEYTRARAEGFVVRDLGEVEIRGKEHPVRIYELIGGEEDGEALR